MSDEYVSEFSELNEMFFTCDETQQDVKDVFDEKVWESRGKALGEQHAEVLDVNLRRLDLCRWQIGDWLVEGVPHYGESGNTDEVICGYRVEGPPDVYSVAQSVTGLKRNTLKDLCSTARRVPESVRTDACSWTHHRALINALPKADENTLRNWLQRATDEKMSVAKLQRTIRRPKGAPIKEKTFRVTVALSTWETLKDFADNEECAVQKVASRWIDEHASSEETQSFRKGIKHETEERRYEKRRRVGERVARDYDPLRLRRD